MWLSDWLNSKKAAKASAEYKDAMRRIKYAQEQAAIAKAGLVRLELWVPADKEAEVRDAVDEIITPPRWGGGTLASSMRLFEAMDAQSKAMAERGADIGIDK